jgi:hypothetical protein
VQAVMDKALERDAKLRYQTASDFGHALWNAVDDMPAVAVAEGGTLMMAPVPPTRVGAATPGVPGAVAIEKKSRTPMLVGAAVAAAVAAATAAAFFTVTPKATPAATVPSRVTSGAPAAATLAATPAQVTASVPGVGGATGPSSGNGAEARVATHAGGTAATPTKAEAAGPSIAEQLAAIDKRAEKDGTARQALDEADALRPKLTTSQQKVYLAIIRAQALGTLGQDANACSALKDALPMATGTSDESKLRAMLQSCP